MINEKKSFNEFLTSTKNDSRKIKFVSTIIALNQKKQQVKKNEKNYASSENFEKKNKQQNQIKEKLKKSLSKNIFEKYKK